MFKIRAFCSQEHPQIPVNTSQFVDDCENHAACGQCIIEEVTCGGGSGVSGFKITDGTVIIGIENYTQNGYFLEGK